MARSGRLGMALALPACALGAAVLAGWLLYAGTDPGTGPMTMLPWVPRHPQPAAAALGEMAPPANALETLTPLEAQARNAALPYSHAPLLAAATYATANDDEPAASALECLTSAIYYEAGQEPLAGKQAVAQVVVNRWASSPFPKTICGVIQQGAPRPGCQFTFECDGSLARKPEATAWAAAQAVARTMLDGAADPDVGGATHYHADYVFPVWAPTMIKLVKVGRHIFYRWPGAARTLVSPPQPPQIADVSASDNAPLANVVDSARPVGPLAGQEPAQISSDAAPPTSPGPAARKEPLFRSGAVPTEPAPSIAAAPSRSTEVRRPPAARRALPDPSLRNGPL